MESHGTPRMLRAIYSCRFHFARVSPPCVISQRPNRSKCHEQKPHVKDIVSDTLKTNVPNHFPLLHCAAVKMLKDNFRAYLSYYGHFVWYHKHNTRMDGTLRSCFLLPPHQSIHHPLDQPIESINESTQAPRRLEVSHHCFNITMAVKSHENRSMQKALCAASYTLSPVTYFHSKTQEGLKTSTYCIHAPTAHTSSTYCRCTTITSQGNKPIGRQHPARRNISPRRSSLYVRN